MAMRLTLYVDVQLSTISTFVPLLMGSFGSRERRGSHHTVPRGKGSRKIVNGENDERQPSNSNYAFDVGQLGGDARRILSGHTTIPQKDHLA